MGFHHVNPGAQSAADIADQASALERVVAANSDALDRARALILGRPLVRLLGIGSSRHVAGYTSHVLDVLADTPATALPAPGAAVAQPRFERSHPLVALSQSGRTPAILDMVTRAREADVDVVAITNEPDSPLEELASVTLQCQAGPERVVPATKSVTASMLLACALAGVDSRNLQHAVQDAIELDVSRVVLGEVPATIVCAGFAGQWIADEVALKFAEMAGLSLTSQCVVEHFHGPRAANAAALAFLDPTDPNSSQLARQREVRTVGPSHAMDVVTPSTGVPALDAIITVIAGQRIAHAWAVAIGQDPDADRGLSKVTDTR